MLRFQSFCLLVISSLELLAPTAFAIPAPLGKRQTAPFSVNGVQNGQVLPRLEIRDLQGQQPDQFNIFILAMSELQRQDQSQFLSHFQLAGIHGVPQATWNGVQGVNNPQNPGYCTHVSNIFLTWHRPYLALYEQALQSHALDVANQYPAGSQRDRFVTAANQLRLPFWDWARDGAVPSSFTQSQIQVVTPTGTQTIRNPLYSYVFHPIDPGLYYSPYVNWPQTLRWPTSTNADASSQQNIFVSQMSSNQAQAKQRLYNMLTGNSNFTQIGTSAWIPQSGPGSYDSMESIHDQVHGTIGGTNYGDMSVIPVSAFDPVFWLHHAMIDRSFAMWQALYPDSYVEPMAQKQGTFWYNAGDVMDSRSPLKPFYADPSGNFWTSDSVRDTKTFGYTYPELTGGDQSSIRASINSLYASSRTNEGQKARRDTASGAKDVLDGATSGTKSRLYQINYRAPKNSLGGSFYIDFFLGTPLTEDPHSWLHDVNLIGSQAVLSTSLAGAGPVTIAGCLPLNKFLDDLISLGKLVGLTEDVVVKLLQDKITWRVRSSDYSSIPVANIPELVVSLSSIEYIPPKSADEFPQYVGSWNTYTAVTANKVGGLKVAANI